MKSTSLLGHLRDAVIATIALAMLIASDARAQALDAALRWSPDGVCIFTGDLLARQASTPIDALVVQRDEGAGYVTIGQIARPSLRQEFENIAGPGALADLRRMKSLHDDAAAWEFLRAHGNPADYGLLALDLRFQRALGAMFLDEGVKTRQAGAKLSYRLLARRNGTIDNEGPSGSVIAGIVPQYAAPRLTRSHATDSSVEALWSIRPAVDGPMWADVYIQRGGRGAFEKFPRRILAGRQGDSVRFFFSERIETENLYRICVRPLDLVGNPGPLSDTALLLTVSAEHSPLLEDVTAADSAVGIMLHWKPLPAKLWYTGIEISRSKDPEKNYRVLSTISPYACSYLDVGVLPDNVYYYRLHILTAVDGNARLAGSTSTPHRNTSSAPLAPNGLTAKPEGRGVRLRWEPVAAHDLFAYFIYRGTSLSDSMQQISPALKETAFLDTSATLSGRLTYVYVVRAVNSDQRFSDPSIAAFAKPLRPSPPSAVLGLSAFHSGTRVQLTWPDMTRIDGGIVEYRVFRRVADQKAPQYTDRYTGSEGSRTAKELGFTFLAATREPHFDDTAPLQGNALYTVSAVDLTGVEGPLAPPTSAQRPQSPAASVLLQGAHAILSGIDVTWYAVPDGNVNGYAIYRRLPSDATPSRIATEGNNATSHVDASAKPGVLYFYSVAAVTANGEGPRSKEKGAIR